MRLPTGINVHGFLTINGQKMSKSLGTGILAKEFAELCDPQLLRYYFACKLNNKVEDIDLNLEDFVQKINSDLIGKFLNIASRSASFLKKNNNVLSKKIDEDLVSKLIDSKNQIIDFYETRNFIKVTQKIMELADVVNKYINDNKPWKLNKSDSIYVASTAINALNILSIFLKPIIPKISAKVFDFMNMPNQNFDDINNKVKNITEYKQILTRIDKIKFNEEDDMNEENYINIDDFHNVDLRVAKILEAKNVEEADKLIQLKLDVGKLGTKNVFAGIKSVYSPDELEGKLVVLVNNLKPRKMRFGLSEGMILASSNNEGGVFVISPDIGAKPGEKVK